MINGSEASSAQTFRHLPTWLGGSMEDFLQQLAEADVRGVWARRMNKMSGWQQQQEAAKAGKVS
jgi:hypothetical protein